MPTSGIMKENQHFSRTFVQANDSAISINICIFSVIRTAVFLFHLYKSRRGQDQLQASSCCMRGRNYLSPEISCYLTPTTTDGDFVANMKSRNVLSRSFAHVGWSLSAEGRRVCVGGPDASIALAELRKAQWIQNFISGKELHIFFNKLEMFILDLQFKGIATTCEHWRRCGNTQHSTLTNLVLQHTNQMWHSFCFIAIEPLGCHSLNCLATVPSLQRVGQALSGPLHLPR